VDSRPLSDPVNHLDLMAHQGYDLQLTRYDERGWRATFYTTGMEHSPTSATGTGWEPTPWRATQRAAWARPGMGWYAVAMETNEISEHLFRVYAFVRDQRRWVTAHEITDGANVASRTARAHALRLVKAGIFDQAEVFPGHRYRLAVKADKRNRGFVQRLEQASEVFGPKSK
jgi:hypothetical protein